MRRFYCLGRSPNLLHEKNKTEEELESLEIYDDLFASLLNPNRQVAIGEHVFEIDVVNDRRIEQRSIPRQVFREKENKILI